MFLKHITNRLCEHGNYTLVSSWEQLWHHWVHQRIHAAKRILYASISVFLFERVRKRTSCERDNKRILWNTRWRHGCSWGETKYNVQLNIKTVTLGQPNLIVCLRTFCQKSYVLCLFFLLFFYTNELYPMRYYIFFFKSFSVWN